MRASGISLFVILTVISLTSGEKVSYDNHKVYRLTPKDEEAYLVLKDLEMNPEGLGFWGRSGPGRRSADVMVPPQLDDMFNGIAKLYNFETEVFIENVQDLIDNERPEREEDGDLREEGDGPAFALDDYHTLDEISSWLSSLSLQYKDNVMLISGGKSHEGRDLLGVRVQFSEDNVRRAVVLEGTIHANEWISTAVVTYILNALLTSEDAAVRNMAESYDWYVFPVVNPDGYEYTHTVDRMWRKTRVPYGEGYNCYGADPNRNWDFHWNEDEMASTDPCTEMYGGPTAFSEPSMKSYSWFLSTLGERIKAYISFHSYHQALLIPYGHTTEHLDNYNELLDVGLKAVESLKLRNGTEYTVGSITEIMYVATGSSMDWVKGYFHTPITYAYELRDTGTYGFLLPADQIVPSGLETLDSLVTIFQNFSGSGQIISSAFLTIILTCIVLLCGLIF